MNNLRRNVMTVVPFDLREALFLLIITYAAGAAACLREAVYSAIPMPRASAGAGPNAAGCSMPASSGAEQSAIRDQSRSDPL